MLDIIDKNGKVVAVIMDDGTVVKKSITEDKPGTDLETLIREQLKNKK